MINSINIGLLEANPTSIISQAFVKQTKQNFLMVRPEILQQLMLDISMCNLQVIMRVYSFGNSSP